MSEIMTAAPASDPSGDIGEIVRSQGVLVSVEITSWSARKLDRRVTRDATERAGADADAGRFNKHLLGGRVQSYNAIIAAIGRARALVHDETLPWGNDGTRLLPTANYLTFAQRIRAAREEVRNYIDAFIAEYPAIVADARARLGDMYDPADYPPADVVAGRFRFRVHFTPVPAATDLRLSLPDNVLAHIERSVTARVERSIDSAVRAGWDRLYAAVERLRDKLAEIIEADSAGDSRQRRFHAALLENAVETAETLKRLNVLQDPNLERAADRIISELSVLDAAGLRKDAASMREAARATSDILHDLAAIYGGPEGGV